MNDKKLVQPPYAPMPAFIVVIGASLACLISVIVALSWVFGG